jgi:hypothetical protein
LGPRTPAPVTPHEPPSTSPAEQARTRHRAAAGQPHQELQDVSAARRPGRGRPRPGALRGGSTVAPTERGSRSWCGPGPQDRTRYLTCRADRGASYSASSEPGAQSVPQVTNGCTRPGDKTSEQLEAPRLDLESSPARPGFEGGRCSLVVKRRPHNVNRVPSLVTAAQATPTRRPTEAGSTRKIRVRRDSGYAKEGSRSLSACFARGDVAVITRGQGASCDARRAVRGMQVASAPLAVTPPLPGRARVLVRQGSR